MNAFRWRRGTSAIGRCGWTALSWQKHLRLLRFRRMGLGRRKPKSLQQSPLEPLVPSIAVELSFFPKAERFAFCTSGEDVLLGKLDGGICRLACKAFGDCIRGSADGRRRDFRNSGGDLCRLSHRRPLPPAAKPQDPRCGTLPRLRVGPALPPFAACDARGSSRFVRRGSGGRQFLYS